MPILSLGLLSVLNYATCLSVILTGGWFSICIDLD